ncbi:CD109 antigen-like [Anopheles funestus]|uniref:CD109 antigen-like n=1 Tax=Anopheles funestus TaxID=62324 RepID=UPI0020C5BD37|nr:CD109 antigen-like [Anopheles funestus]
MLQSISSQILTVVIFIGAAHGILVVGPKFIRANQDYTVAISNFKSNLTNVNLILRIEGRTDDGRNVLNVTKMVNLPNNVNKRIFFKMPKDLSSGFYKIMIEGQRGFAFYKKATLVYLGKSESGLIQINKPAFKPGDTVQFRVIVLDTELKPPSRVKTVHVTICDPQNNVVRQWASAELHVGVFENNLQISPTPMLGIWNISVQLDGELLVSKTFEVKEYVLSSFDIEVVPTVIPLGEHQSLSLTITANYHVRKPVKGLAIVELYLEDDKLYQQKEFEIHGIRHVEMRFFRSLEMQDDQQDVRVKTTFIEQSSNHTVVKESQITVYKYVYSVELIKDISYFRPGLPFKCALQFRYHDGTPAKGITGKVEVMDIEYQTNATSDDEGLIKLELNPTDNIEEMYITFSNQDGFYFNEGVDKAGGVTNVFIKLELNSPIKKNKILQFWVTSNEQMTFFVYYVISKGNIIDAGFISPNKQNKYPLRFKATEKMIPKAKVIVMTVVNKTVLHDVLDIDFDELLNKIKMSINKQEVKPGQEIEILMSGRPGSYVGLAAYVKDVLEFNQNHDLFWKDIMRVYNGFGLNVENEFDKFSSMGVFVTTLDDITFNEAHDMLAREGLYTDNPITKLALYRTNFAESWLWKNVTIGGSGTHKMIEVVPDTITSWYLTGFSIDPEYGFGIIKKPIEFTTILPFYIVDSLPYSIKRGEVVELQFTLFNNLGEEYNAEVTLYNVFKQMEFIGRPLEAENYTKSVSVPSKLGVPISFLVKARSLGEITVRIEATIKSIQEKEGLEKVIRVTPESLLKQESRSFYFETKSNRTFFIYLDMKWPKVDKGLSKIMFRVNPNLLQTLTINNLYDLLAVWYGDGEQTMANFAPNILVLDYLFAIGSKEQNLIVRATFMILQGYFNQMLYHQTDGSFGVWQNYGGSVFLTAFVAKSMQTASKFITEVDVAMVEKAYDWLASKQHSSGRFDEVGHVQQKDMQGGLRNGISLTSYVLTALLENENAKVKHAAVIQKAMSYLSSKVEYIQNPYDLSIATYALMLYGHEKKTTTLDKLIGLSTTTNHDNDMVRYWNTTNSIEATAYALLSFVLAEKYEDGIPVMRWLVNQRYVTGSFPRTQDTFVGLKALTKLTEKISPSRNNYTIQLKYKKATRYFHINSQDVNIIDFEDIPEDTKSLEINVDGVGFGLLQVIYQYSLNIVNFEQRFKLDVDKQNTGSDYELRLKVCANYIPKLMDKRSNMALIEVYFPSGYVVDQNAISEQTYFNPIQKTEIRYGGTSVVVYYNNMGFEWNCFTVTAYRRLKVALKRPAYVVVYDYYDPNLNAIKLYEVDNQEVCEICDEGDCPKECKKG